MRLLLAAGLAAVLAACGPAGTTPTSTAGAKAADAAAWAKYAPWKSDLPEVVKTGSGLECVELASGPEGGVPPTAS